MQGVLYEGGDDDDDAEFDDDEEEMLVDAEVLEFEVRMCIKMTELGFRLVGRSMWLAVDQLNPTVWVNRCY